MAYVKNAIASHSSIKQNTSRRVLAASMVKRSSLQRVTRHRRHCHAASGGLFCTLISQKPPTCDVFFDEITSELSENRLSSDGNRGWGKEKGHGGTGTDDSLNGGVKDTLAALRQGVLPGLHGVSAVLLWHVFRNNLIFVPSREKQFVNPFGLVMWGRFSTFVLK